MAPNLKKSSINGFHHLEDVSSCKQYEVGENTPPYAHAWRYASLKKLLFTITALTVLITYVLSLPLYIFPIVFTLAFVPALSFFLGLNNIIFILKGPANSSSKIDNYIEFLDADSECKYSGKYIPIRDLYELYADEKINFKGDLLTCLERRNEYVTFKLQWWHLRFFLTNFLPEMMFHSKRQDDEQVCDHYDRGNDFYEAFLGPSMIYTTGIKRTEDDTLEEMQMNKVKGVCEKILLKPGEQHLDIGCGWGTLVNYAAEHCGSISTGITLAQKQVEWARQTAQKSGIKSNFQRMDYRNITATKYDKITCLEMAEHVGIRLFPNFLDQVYELLEDDGIFFLQIAGLRRTWQWEDMLWGFFMDTYIFPGADASLPLIFPIGQLEAAGFEIQSVETVGVHYSETIKKWYHNWIKPENKEKMVSRYGMRLYLIFEIFLSWSTIIARQGSSTCFQIVAHKNLNHFCRSQFIKKKPL